MNDPPPPTSVDEFDVTPYLKSLVEAVHSKPLAFVAFNSSDISLPRSSVTRVTTIVEILNIWSKIFNDKKSINGIFIESISH